ncbi:MAG TPA: hypothetical protein VKG23_20555 [Thermoanaerobaculia bacterium]|nr:hypothetical protein [Thermoanaerobaculia bacterium]
MLVDGVRWGALPPERQQDLGQAMAIAKNAQAVRLRDSKTRVLIATCTAAGRCRDTGADEPDPATTRVGEPSVSRD